MDKKSPVKQPRKQPRKKPRRQWCACFSAFEFRKVQRFRSWTVLMFLSLAQFLAVMDAFPPSERDNNVILAIVLSGISFGISFIIASMHYLKCTRRLTGNLFEFFWSVVLFSAWIAGSFFILNPNNNIATSTDVIGVEYIQYSNIYGLTWLTIFSSLYLVLSFHCDVYTMNSKLICWIFVFSASITLVCMSSHLKNKICALDTGETRCNRTKYAMTIGCILLALTVIALLLFLRSEITPRKSLVLESTCIALYGHGVVMITSVKGPATNFSTIYFATWCGAAFSLFLIINSGHDKIASEETVLNNTRDSVEVDMGEVTLNQEANSRKVSQPIISSSVSKDMVEVKLPHF